MNFTYLLILTNKDLGAVTFLYILSAEMILQLIKNEFWLTGVKFVSQTVMRTLFLSKGF